MKKIERVKLLLNSNDYDNIKSFFKEENIWKGNITIQDICSDGNRIIVKVIENKVDEYRSYIFIELKIYNPYGDILIENRLPIYKISDLTSIFSLKFDDTEYLISIDKECKEFTLEDVKERLNTAKDNCLYEDYLRNLVIFNNFNDNFELLETTFSLLAGSNHIIKFDEDVIDMIKEKFKYYGYDYSNILEIYDVENGIVCNDTLDDILYNLVGVLLFIIYDRYNCTYNDAYKNFAYSQGRKYLKLLVEKNNASYLI